jgi:toxin YoeB
MRKLEWSPTATEHLAYWKEKETKKYHKILTLCQNACIDPKKGLGKPEPLKHEWSGYWSRRIDKEHRLVYRFDEETVYVVQARYHYV